MLRRSHSLKNAAMMQERQMEEARMRDVEMLLESLFLREEVTMRLIADCLYDVGSVNLLNQRIHSKPLNRFMKVIARRSKPIFRFFMMRWSKENCPRMIADWLHSQVRFAPSEVVIPEVLSPEVSSASSPDLRS